MKTLTIPTELVSAWRLRAKQYRASAAKHAGSLSVQLVSKAYALEQVLDEVAPKRGNK